ncbi:MAG: hypothetical protein IIA68_09930, partial [Proteobacteria bacterium]|nr:hypothetical protein [Pseudomonadota bacterium]
QDDNGDPITANDLAVWLSGFNKDVTLTVIVDACESGQLLNDMKVKVAGDAITDANGAPINTDNLSMLTSTDKGTCSQGIPKITAQTTCADVYLNFEALIAQDASLITVGDAPAPGGRRCGRRRARPRGR